MARRAVVTPGGVVCWLSPEKAWSSGLPGISKVMAERLLRSGAKLARLEQLRKNPAKGRSR